MKLLLVLVLALGLASCSLRQTEWFSQSCVAADGITTVVAFERGGYTEANKYMPKTTPGTMAFTAAVMVANHYIGRALEKKWEGAGKTWFIGLGIAKGYAATHNILLMSCHVNLPHPPSPLPKTGGK